MANHLTTRAIEALKPGPKRREVPDGTVGGLYLTVQPSGARSWAFRYRFAGKGAKLTLGPYPAIDVRAARLLAGEAAVTLARGGDPAAAKRARQRAAEPVRDVFVAVAREYVERHARRHTRERSWRETERLLKAAVAAWGGRRLSDLTRNDVARLLDGIVERGAPVSANRSLAALQRLGNWCVERGLVAVSPFASIKPPTPEVSRSRVLGKAEIAAAWAAFGRAGVVGDAAKVLLLTGSRLREVTELRWDEIDMGAAVWVLPGERAKNGAQHEIPLSPAVLAILAARRAAAPGCKFVFSANGRKPIASVSRGKRLTDASMAAELGAALPHWVMHDLRRTAASGMAGLGTQPHIVEACLNHRSGVISGISAVYNRHSYAAEKREALTTWAAELARITAPVAAAAPLALAA